MSESEGAQASDLAAFVSLSQRMLEAARVGEWESVISLESERSPIFERLAAVLVAAEHASDIPASWRPALLAAVESDGQLTLLAQQAQKVLAQGTVEMESSRRAVNAYLDNLPL